MPKNIKEERMRWIRPVLDGEISIKSMAKVAPFCERTIKYWLFNYRDNGIAGLEPKSTRPRTSPKETAIRIKERILELRRETNLSALKLYFKLKKENINLHPRTIGKIIKNEGLTRRYHTKKIKYRYVKALLKSGELVEIDVKYVPDKVNFKRYYQFTAIDVATRWRLIRIYDDMSNYHALRFLNELIKTFPYKIQAVKTDNATYFTNRYVGYLKSTDPYNPRLHPFDLLCQKLNIIHYLTDPGKPQQNAHVERSHRTDQEHFYERIKYQTEDELKYQARLWNMYYNDLEHISLDGLTPNEALRLRGQNVRA
jgi:transposase InsO family protein